MIEIRSDLIADERSQDEMTARLAAWLIEALDELG